MNPDQINALAEQLNRFGFVRKFDIDGEPQAGVLANALADMHVAMTTISSHLAKLTQSGTDEEAAKAILMQVRDELRHIIYHVKDTQFFCDIVDQA